MFRFADPQYLYWILVAILLMFLALFLLRRQQKNLQKFFHPEMLKKLLSSLSLRKRKLKIYLEALTLIILCLAMARPQMGQGSVDVKNEGVELVLAFDVSKSMLAEDMKPSRLDYAKAQAQKLLDKMSGHKVGLIVFAGNAVLSSPMTPDYSALNMYIDSITTDSVSTQGTDYTSVLSTAAEAFKNGGVEADATTKVSRVVVIFSDGEDHAQGAVDLAAKMAEEGIRIFTIGVGTNEGGKIPIRDRFGYLKGFKKDAAGKVIVTKTKSALLKEIAQAGQGAYYHANFGARHIDNIVSDLDKLEKAEFDSEVLQDYNEYFQWFLFLAFFVFFIELVLKERKSKKKIWRGRFNEEYKS